MKCTDLLIQDHKIILRCLVVLEQLALKVQQGEYVLPADTEAVLRFLRDFGDNHHQTKEESALFPELRRTAGFRYGPLRQILFEHDQERSLAEGLEESLRTKNGVEFVYFAYRLTGFIRDHIYKEEHVLFDIVEYSLSTEQDEKITSEFAGFQIDPGIVANLQRLESKYLRKGAVSA